MKIIHLLILSLFLNAVQAQEDPKVAIMNVLDNQITSWNSGNLVAFMEGYWKNDSVIFVGKNDVAYGHKNALANYKRNYPDTASMGKLAFRILKMDKLSPDTFFVVGKWMLKRSVGDLSGHYTLIFRKIKGRWLIVADHSS